MKCATRLLCRVNQGDRPCGRVIKLGAGKPVIGDVVISRRDQYLTVGQQGRRVGIARVGQHAGCRPCPGARIVQLRAGNIVDAVMAAGGQHPQEYRAEDGTLCQWMFTEITAKSFHWIGRESENDGKTWKVNTEFFLRRKMVEGRTALDSTAG